jgi:hypothetical protein
MPLMPANNYCRNVVKVLIKAKERYNGSTKIRINNLAGQVKMNTCIVPEPDGWMVKDHREQETGSENKFRSTCLVTSPPR